MGIASRCAYGGTVPVGDEARELDDIRVIVATPEALSGLLSANPSFFDRVTLVICDEGHLLDGQSRGVGLELLLARMRSREVGAPRFVFISAIVPNIEEINGWLGGSDETVIRSDYRPALAEFAVLESTGTNSQTEVALRLHAHDDSMAYEIERFLSRSDFKYRNEETGRENTYSFSSIKSQAIASARKALSMGAVAVFATNKRGHQGAIGLAEELVKQLAIPLRLPKPSQYVSSVSRLGHTLEYLLFEFGSDWIGYRALRDGAVLHHGDIPQESREVVESLVRDGVVRLAICTSTLAEGVNLPIRTLVLYSVQRRSHDGAIENLLGRDIKNLVGRAGRAGVTTKGLVICANSNQWHIIEPVALQSPGERVSGALLELMVRLREVLAQQSLVIDNEILENTTDLHTLVDGIDATLVDLAADEIGENELVRIAGNLSEQTFAARQADEDTSELMHDVFELRAKRIIGIRNAGRLDWVRETGTRVRMLDSVESALLPLIDDWDEISNPLDSNLIDAILEWAWDQPDISKAIDEAYRGEIPSHEDFKLIVTSWIEGESFVSIANISNITIDTMLSIHARVIGYALQVAVEQAVGLLLKFLESQEKVASEAVISFPEHLRFGIPSLTGCRLAAIGVRHRRAAIALGASNELTTEFDGDLGELIRAAREIISDRDRWVPLLGSLVYENTQQDLANKE